jgi:hypothetical protein
MGGLYELALGSGFVAAFVWSIYLSLQRNALRKRSEQNVRGIIARINEKEHYKSERSDNRTNR